MLARLPPDLRVIADAAYDSAQLRRWLADRGSRVVIPDRRTRKQPYPFDAVTYRRRNIVERTFCRLKDFRRLATRYDRLDETFVSTLCIAAALGWSSRRLKSRNGGAASLPRAMLKTAGVMGHCHLRGIGDSPGELVGCGFDRDQRRTYFLIRASWKRGGKDRYHYRQEQRDPDMPARATPPTVDCFGRRSFQAIFDLPTNRQSCVRQPKRARIRRSTTEPRYAASLQTFGAGRLCHDCCGDRTANAELLTSVEGASSRPVRRIVLRSSRGRRSVLPTAT
jgi:transposase